MTQDFTQPEKKCGLRLVHHNPSFDAEAVSFAYFTDEEDIEAGKAGFKRLLQARIRRSKFKLVKTESTPV